MTVTQTYIDSFTYESFENAVTFGWSKMWVHGDEGYSSPCFLSVVFPPGNLTTEGTTGLRLREDIVRNMYT